MSSCGRGSPPSRCATSRCEPCVQIEIVEPRAASRPLALEHGGEDLDDRAERGPAARSAGCAGGRWERRVLREGGPAEVVEVVTCAAGVGPVGSEAGDRAVRRARSARRPARRRDGRRPRAEALQHDVRARAEGVGRVPGSVLRSRRPLLAPVQGVVPGGRQRGASGRRPATRVGRRGRPGAAAPGKRRGPGSSGSGRRRAGRRAVAPPRERTLRPCSR